MKRIVMKQKEMDEYFQFINTQFGQVKEIIAFNDERLNFSVLVIPPTKKENYYTLVTMGLSAIKLYKGPKKVQGFEFFVNLPPQWKITSEANYEEGWIIKVLQDLAYEMQQKKVILPGSTFTFGMLHKDSEHVAVIVDFSDKKTQEQVVKPCGKKMTFILELTTLLPDELTAIIQGGEDTTSVLKQKLMGLPYIQLTRESLIKQRKK